MKGVKSPKITRLLDGMIANNKDAIKLNRTPDGAFMAFNIDKLGTAEIAGAKGFYLFAFSHYYRHPSGDMIADPDMQVIYSSETKEVYPYTYQDSFGYKQSYFFESGDFYPKMQADQASFLRTWLRNVVNQQGL